MGRSKATTKKYNLQITCDGNPLHEGQYASLREISDYLHIPYHNLTDVCEGRRNSFTKWEECRFFPVIKIDKIENNTN